MSDLRRARLVDSSRGKLGGYKLARPADSITFAQIMRVTDGPLALIPCASPNFYQRCEDCIDEGQCVLRRVMSTVRNEVSDILDRLTLADALAGRPGLRLDVVVAPSSLQAAAEFLPRQFPPRV